MERQEGKMLKWVTEKERKNRQTDKHSNCETGLPKSNQKAQERRCQKVPASKGHKGYVWKNDKKRGHLQMDKKTTDKKQIG